MKPKVYYGIPALNEAENILKCFDALSRQSMDAEVETLVCTSKCVDNTEEKIEEGARKYPGLGIRHLCCGKGKSVAQNAIAKAIGDREAPLVFIDADTTPDRKCIETLYDNISRIDGLIVAGAWPVPRRTEGMPLLRRALFRVLHARAIHPESEVSVNDVSAYKRYVDGHPPAAVSPEFEKRSKIYFHGRTFMLKSADFLELPEDENVADDTFMPNFIHTKYGPGSIRMVYDATTYYEPMTLAEHLRFYRRIYSDLRSIDDRGLFREARMMEKTKLDWKLIMTQGPGTVADLLAYSTLFGAEEMLYRLLPKRSLSENWHPGK